jgi:hypothetical protein
MSEAWEPSNKICTVTDLWGHQDGEKRDLFIPRVMKYLNNYITVSTGLCIRRE